MQGGLWGRLRWDARGENVDQREVGWGGETTYRTSALLFCAANLEIWQAGYTWVFFQFCVDGDEGLGCTRISTAMGALDLRGTDRFLASAASVTGLDGEKSDFPYCSFPLRVGGDGVGDESCFQRIYWKKTPQNVPQNTGVRCRARSWRLCRLVVVFPTPFPFPPLRHPFLVYGCPRLATIDKAQSTPS